MGQRFSKTARRRNSSLPPLGRTALLGRKRSNTVPGIAYTTVTTSPAGVTVTTSPAGATVAPSPAAAALPAGNTALSATPTLANPASGMPFSATLPNSFQRTHPARAVARRVGDSVCHDASAHSDAALLVVLRRELAGFGANREGALNMARATDGYEQQCWTVQAGKWAEWEADYRGRIARHLRKMAGNGEAGAE